MFTITLIGRPNVGKSTLFNRLVGRRDAIVTSVPGTTRDRREGVTEWNGLALKVLDTGGLYAEETELFEEAIRKQCEQAIKESQLVWVIMDVRQGLTLADEHLFSWVRRLHPHVWIIVNKVDTPNMTPLASDFHALGADKVITISAESGIGVGDLLDHTTAFARTLGYEASSTSEPSLEEQQTGKIAIVGRPNAGKSSMVNRLVGYERVIVSDVPGTTRDVVDVPINWGNHTWILLDTAGHKKRRKARDWPERVAIIKMHQTIKRADMVWLMVDAQVGITRRDRQLAGWAKTSGKALVVILNKWDCIDHSQRRITLDRARSALKFVAYAPIIPLSVKTGEGFSAFEETVQEVWSAYNRRVATSPLNQFIENEHHRILTWYKGRPIKIKYITQVATRPPTFVVFTNRPGQVKPEHLQPIKKWLRETFHFVGTPIRVKCKDVQIVVQS